MKVHLIKDSEVGKEVFSEVLDLLQSISGPIEFLYDINNIVNFEQDDVEESQLLEQKSFENVFHKADTYNANIRPSRSMDFEFNFRPFRSFSFPLFRKTTKWTTIFKKCTAYRKKNQIPDNEFVILLTEVSNTNNWFASLDEKMPFNGFIHTSDWNHYIKCQDSFPIAFEVIALVLQKHMFNDYNEARSSVHIEPIGCVNDLCLEKKNIILKLRTADICEGCMDKLKGKLSIAEIQHALNIMESLRVKMLFSQNLKQNVLLSKLVIDEKNRIFLPDFGNIEIKLRPLEKAIYLLYLKHPEGIGLSFLCDHKKELYDIYASLSSIGALEEMKSRIDDIVNVTKNSSVEKISKIKASFTKSIGDKLAKHYYIQGGNGEVKNIKLNRDNVVWPK
jgi:hypothetical protein